MQREADPPKPKCFIIMPITVPDHLLETYGNDKDHFNDVLKHLFEPAVTLAGFKPVPPSSDGSRVIHRDIAEKLHSAKMVLCDMSALNPNVFFELGMRTAMNKPICLVRDTSLPKPPFDTGVIQCHPYNSAATWHLDDQREALAKHIIATAKTPEYKGGKNAWWQVMGVNYAPASIESGGDTADLNRLKLDQIISMLKTRGTPETRRNTRAEAISRLKQLLPPGTRCTWQVNGPKSLCLSIFQELPLSVIRDLQSVAKNIGMSLTIERASREESEDLYPEPTDE